MESFTELFTQRLTEQSRGIPSSIQQTLAIHWQHFVDRCNEENLQYNLADISSSFMDELVTCWAGSDFAAQQCIRNPEWLFDYHRSVIHKNNLTGYYSKKLSLDLEKTQSEEQLLKIIRQYRNREMLRIIWCDLNRQYTMQETTADLTVMAEVCIKLSLNWLYHDLCKSLGTPHGAAYGNEPEPQPLIILGMGKLGATELNLSSDIDLIFTYPYQGETIGGKRSLTNQEFFNRLGQKLIRVLDNQTADGFVFRVDMRLRPYGSSGALTMSFAAMEQYYQDQGRDWERYAMIKARIVAGDIDAGNYLLEQLKPFVYRRYIDFGSISALRDMKHLIQREVKRKGMRNNIKLGPGGIREIEFIVQSFQLIHGGRDRSLQQKNLLQVLNILEVKKYVSEEMASELRNAYIFLRNLEHALQALADRQTQDLPTDRLSQCRLAFTMGYKEGYKNWPELLTRLNEYRDSVIQHFDYVIADPDKPDSPEDENDHWRSLWQSELNRDEELELMTSEGFGKQQESLNRIIALRESKAIARMRRQGRERLDAFIPVMLNEITASETPDVSLQRLIPLVEAVLRRTAYLVLLMENRAALTHLNKLCTASPWIADQIARNPVLLDEFLNLGDLYNPPKRNQLADELRQQLAHIPEDDLENQMEALRHFKMAHVLRVSAAQVAGTLPLMKESDYLTWIAEVVIEQVVEIAWRTLTERHGIPLNSEGERCNPGFIVIGYGKLGGIELGPGSDLDLVFVHDGALNRETDGLKPVDSNTFYTRLGQRIIHILTTQTASGLLYETDMRLRPSGSSGLLVNSFAAFEKYQLKDAWTWEHQALVRSRVVAGDPSLATRFDQLRRAVLTGKRDQKALRSDVVGMRLKMKKHLASKKHSPEIFNLKHDEGGIIDIEFLMQYAVLQFATEHESLLKWTDNIRISEELEKAGILSDEEAYWLREAYKTFRLGIHQRALQNEPPEASANIADQHRQQVLSIWRNMLGGSDCPP